MTKFRKWLIRKLGGVIQPETPYTFKSDYWKEVCVRTSLYVPKERYNNTAAPVIEQELARKLSQELLDRDLLCFSDSAIPDVYGDFWVTCQAHMLTFKNRQPYHMKSRLSGVLERRRLDE